jgi:hypothetical protein
MSIETMKQALEALEAKGDAWVVLERKAKVALRQAIEQAEKQEPFEYWNAVEGWVKIDEMREHFDSVGCGTIYKSGGEGRVPLYTTAPPRQPLTDEEIFEVHKRVDSMQYLTFARAIEAAHGVGEKAWVGLNEYERKFLEASNSQFYVVHHDNKNDISYVATKVDWNSLFEAIEAKLKEKNGL